MLQGLFLGFPLGVCVNCATPIVQGLNKAKLPLETLLSVLFASPSLNIVVISMLFSLLPLYFGVIKLLAFFFFIALIYFFFEKTALFETKSSLTTQECRYLPKKTNKANRLKIFNKELPSYVLNLWMVCKISLPFMLLAALLGSILIELLPVENLQNMNASFGLIFVVSLIGSFLPVPIAFDVILVSALHSIGLNTKFLATLLFTLGIFSIYPYLVLSKDISKKIANTLFAIVVFVGILASYGTSAYEKIHDEQTRSQLSLFRKNNWKVENLLKLAQTECSQYFIVDDRKKSLCTKATLENAMLYIGDKTICEQFTHQEVKTNCIALFQESGIFTSSDRNLNTKNITTENPAIKQILNATSSGGSHQLCYKLLNKKEQSICVVKTMISRYGFDNKKENNCRRVLDSYYQKQCFKVSEIKKQAFLANWNACLQIDQIADELYAQETCFSDAFVAGFLQKGVEFCETISREDVQKNCWHVQKTMEYQDKQIHQGASACYNLKKGKQYPLICTESYTDQKLLLKQCMSADKKTFQAKLCLKSHFQAYGFEVNDCSYAPDIVIMNVCEDIYHYELALKLINPATCFDVKEEYAQNLCILKTIQKKMHQHISKIIISNFQKKLNKISSKKLKKKEQLSEYASPTHDTMKSKNLITDMQLRLVQDNLIIQGFSHEKRKNYGTKPFTKVSADQYQIDIDFFKLIEFTLPYLYSRGIAGGDIDKNNFEDIIMAGDRKIFVFLNQGNMKFQKRQISLEHIKEKSVFLVAFVDWDNDTWLDIFFTTYGGGKYVYLNQKNKIIQLENPSGMLFNVSLAAAIYDIDQNNYPDILVGHWTSGSNVKNKYSHNLLYMNIPNQIITHRLYEAPGETLSVLFSDINHDSSVDLLIGNDFLYPDMVYLGTKNGSFELLDNTNPVIPVTSENTMSFDSADFNNDLRLDIFSADMIVSDDVQENYCDSINKLEHKKRCQKNLKANKITRKGDPQLCDSIMGENLIQECWFNLIRQYAVKTKNSDLCTILQYVEPTQYLMCSRSSAQKDFGEILDSFQANFIPQINRNALLMGNRDGTFKNQVNTMQAADTHWSWNSKAADLDNDTWQDIYVGNGLMGFGIQSNVFLHNQKGKKFESREKFFGLEDYLHTPSYIYTDMDNDGDLDIVTRRINAPMGLFLNNNTKGNSITFLLQDSKGNFFALGAKVYIFYGNNKAQLREIKSGGGFMSFNSSKLHFGLGQYKKINKIKIIWPDRSESFVHKELPVNYHYVVTRTKKKQVASFSTSPK